MQDQSDMARRAVRRRAIEADQNLVVIVVKAHRVATADRDTGLPGLLPEALGEPRFAIVLDVVSGIDNDTTDSQRHRLLETSLQR